MKTRKLGAFEVSSLGLGCMSMSHGYGAPNDGESVRVLHRALDLGCNFLDTAALYGFGRNETLIGNTLRERRKEFVLASKCGVFKNAEGKREIDGRPEVLKKTCDDSLQRLQTDVIDLYYLHRMDRKVPIEESVGALSDLVTAGKIRTIGLSEVSANTLRKAHAIHPITAVQSEYSLWTRNAELQVLQTCRELGVAFVAFSPLARGFLTGAVRDNSQFTETDMRRNMPRFQGEHFTRNLRLLDEFANLARAHHCTPSQLALAWVLTRGDHIIPIPGTKHLAYLEENLRARDLTLQPALVQQLDALINQQTVSGPRYNANASKEVDTEDFAGVN
jgi:aryl-alcohol dehydrogenase-like predicted oxidoreductase